MAIARRGIADMPMLEQPQKVFVSHAEEDQEAANHLSDDLKERGVLVWRYQDSRRASIFDAINDALEWCEWFLLVETPASLSSLWVRKELAAAHHLVVEGLIKGIVRVVVKDCSNVRIPPLLADTLAFDAQRGYQNALNGVLSVFKFESEGSVAEPAPPMSVFASFAPKDKPRVLDRIEWMHRASPHCTFVLGEADQRSLDAWHQQEVQRLIRECDRFCLFWSRAAYESRVVKWQWNEALKAVGIETFILIPLDDLGAYALPPELAKARVETHGVIPRATSGKGDGCSPSFRESDAETPRMTRDAGSEPEAPPSDPVAGWKEMRRSKPRSDRQTPCPILEFTATAPMTLMRGRRYSLDIWVHTEEQRPAARERAEAAGKRDSLEQPAGGLLLNRSTKVDIVFRGPGAAAVTKSVTWNGFIACASFSITVSKRSRPSVPCTAAILVEGIEIAQLEFVLSVADTEDLRIAPLDGETTRPRRVFASHASEDLDEVASRVEALKVVSPDLDIFLGEPELESGDEFWPHITGEIHERDTFLLFWSAAASRSETVRRELQEALIAPGIGSIKPVPLEDPRLYPPPPLLSERIDFNTYWLAHLNVTEQPVTKVESVI